LTCQSVETASIKAAVTVGVNVLITSGKERGIINASWNVCEVKKNGNPINLSQVCWQATLKISV
jgi:hypothetical protein